jgi:hypothetical protein
MQIELPVHHPKEVGANQSFINLFDEGHEKKIHQLPPKHDKDPACHEVLIHPGMITHSNPKVQFTCYHCLST